MTLENSFRISDATLRCLTPVASGTSLTSNGEGEKKKKVFI